MPRATPLCSLFNVLFNAAARRSRFKGVDALSIENAFSSLGPWMKYYTWCVGGLCISRTFGINQDGISQGPLFVS